MRSIKIGTLFLTDVNQLSYLTYDGYTITTTPAQQGLFNQLGGYTAITATALGGGGYTVHAQLKTGERIKVAQFNHEKDAIKFIDDFESKYNQVVHSTKMKDSMDEILK